MFVVIVVIRFRSNNFDPASTPMGAMKIAVEEKERENKGKKGKKGKKEKSKKEL